MTGHYLAQGYLVLGAIGFAGFILVFGGWIR
jgi:hypothetical protein